MPTIKAAKATVLYATILWTLSAANPANVMAQPQGMVFIPAGTVGVRGTSFLFLGGALPVTGCPNTAPGFKAPVLCLGHLPAAVW